jgi:purine-nucleoside phosphorylase
MDPLTHELEVAVDAWDAAGLPRPQALVVSGSGLAVDLLAGRASDRRPLQELLPFPLHSIEGHPLSLELLGADTGRPIAYQRGRVHGYQGYTAAQVVFHVRLARHLGAERLLMTNAAGSLRKELTPGSLVAIRDHLNLMSTNPLTGSPPEAWGPRFPDLSDAYDREGRNRLLQLAAERQIELAEGVYAGVAGPSFETPAEVAMLRSVGADLVGMSTVLEVIAARHMGMRCLAVSMVSNHAAGISPGELDHAEVLEAGRAVADDLRRLLEPLLLEWLDG